MLNSSEEDNVSKPLGRRINLYSNEQNNEYILDELERIEEDSLEELAEMRASRIKNRSSKQKPV